MKLSDRIIPVGGETNSRGIEETQQTLENVYERQRHAFWN